MKKRLLGLLALFSVLFVLMACKAPVQAASGAMQGTPASTGDVLTVTMFNCGKADAILVQVGGQNVVVDTGLYDNAQTLIKGLRSKGVKKIDQLYMTHPHADHIGGVLPILNSISVKTIYDTGIINPKSKLYPMILDAAAKKHITVKPISAPGTIQITKDAVFEVLSPTAAKVKQDNPNYDPNIDSLVMRLKYKEFTMMFTADSYKESEYDIMKNYSHDKLKSDVLKVAHHTSNTSTSYEWLKAVNPKVAIASYANKPGVEFGKYPNKKTLNRILDQNIKFYGTEDNGNITVTTDGKVFNVNVERGGAR